MADNPTSGKTPAPRTPRRARKKKAAVETRRQREALYRGMSIEGIRELSWEEQLEIMPSRVRRFFGRSFDDETNAFWKKVQAAGEGDELRTHLRDFPVVPHMVDKIVHVYNGKEFMKVGVTTEMIGHKLGEFALTRKPVKHTGPGVGATRSSKFMPLK